MTAKLLMTAAEIRRDPARWDACRKRGITATDLPKITGLVRRSRGNPYTVWTEKTAGRELTADSSALRRGRELEPVIAADLAAMRPELEILPGGLYASAEHPWLMATFDRFAVDCAAAGYSDDDRAALALAHAVDGQAAYDAIPVELKSVHEMAALEDGERWGEPGTGQVPNAYRAQAYIQMAIWGAEMVIIPAKFMLSWETSLYFIRRTPQVEDDIAFLIGEARAMHDRVIAGDPPPVDWSPETGAALRTLHPLEPETLYRVPKGLARRYQRAWRSVKQAERRLGLAQNLIADRMGGAARAVTEDPERPGKDVTVLSRRAGKATWYDAAQLRQDFPDAAEACYREKATDAVFPGQRWVKLP